MDSIEVWGYIIKYIVTKHIVMGSYRIVLRIPGNISK